MKILLRIILGLALLLILAVIALPYAIQPNDFKPQIAEQVKKRTGRDLAIGGDIGLSFFPWLGLEVSDVSLGNPAGFGTEPFVQIDKAKIRVRLTPLLKKRLEVDQVLLEGLSAHLVTDASGRQNWDFSASEARNPPSNSSSQTSKPPNRQNPPAAAFLVGGVDLKGAKLVWDDHRQGRQVRVENLSLSTGKLAPGEPVDLNLGALVTPEAKRPGYQIQLEARVAMSADGSEIQVTHPGFSVQEQGGKPQIRLSAEDVGLDLKQGQFQVKGLNLSGLLNVPQMPQLLKLEMHTNLAGQFLQMRLNASDFRFKLGDEKGSRQLTGGAQIFFDLPRTMAEIRALHLASDDLNLKGNLRISRLLSDAPAIEGKLSLATFNPRKLMQDWGIQPPQTADAKRLIRTSFSTTLGGNTQELVLNNLLLQLDQTQLKGRLSLRAKPRPKLTFNLTGNQLDLDAYLPPASASSAKPQSKTGQKASRQKSPFESLFIADLNGRLSLDHFSFQGIQAREIELQINQSNRKLSIQQKVGNFYQGSYQGLAVLNGQKPTLVVTKKGRLSGVQIKPLLKALKQDDRLQGKADIDFNTSARGGDIQAMWNSVSGDLKVSIRDGAIQGFNLAEIIRSAKHQWDTLRGKKTRATTSNESPKTDFSSLVATIKLKGPVVNNTRLDLKSPYLRVEGKGQINGKSQQINYQLTTVIVDSAKGQDGKDFKQLTNLPLKMAYKGPISGMQDWRKWKLDLGEVLKAQLKKEAEDEGRRLLEKKLGVSGKDANGKKRRTEDMVIDSLIKRL